MQEINFLKEGSILHYSQKIENFTLERLWKELKVSSNYSKARKEVEEFNRHNRWKKRGIAMIPTKFGISFTSKFMNQVTFMLILFRKLTRQFYETFKVKTHYYDSSLSLSISYICLKTILKWYLNNQNLLKLL